MNKQEVIDDIENAIPDFIFNDFQRGKESGLSYALELVEELDEPEVDEGDEDFGEYSMRNTVTLYHNQNPIAIADCEADAGNGGYYYSVCSLVIKNVHYKVVEA